MACAASAAERRRNVDLKTIRNLPPQHSTLHSKGLDARELPLSAAEGEVFSLDIPFYRAALTEDTTRTMGRIKALYRSQAIACAGEKPYGSRHREDYLAQLLEPGLQQRAQRLYQELDLLQQLRREARCELIVECRKHKESRLLRSIPWLGPIRVALLIGRVQTPHRFRTKRQFWAYCGLALETRSSADYQMVNGEPRRRSKPVFIRGLNLNHNHDLKNLFKSAATTASGSSGVFRGFYENLLLKGMKPELARLTLARKIAAITLHIWKKGEPFDAEYLKLHAA